MKRSAFCLVGRCKIFLLLLAFYEFDSLKRVFNTYTTSVTNLLQADKSLEAVLKGELKPKFNSISYERLHSEEQDSQHYLYQLLFT